MTRPKTNGVSRTYSRLLSQIGRGIRIAGCTLKWNSPVNVIFHATMRCNARCKMCLVWKKVWGPESENRNAMTIDQIERMTRSIGWLLRAEIVGGEPFLRKDIDEILFAFCRNCKPICLTITSNGSLPQRIADTMRQLFAAFPNQVVRVNLSVDGYGTQHDEIRKIPGLYEKCKESAARLREIQKDYPNLTVNLMTVVSHYNHEGIEETIGKIENDFKPDFHSLMNAFGDTPEAVGRDVPIQDYVRLFSEVKGKRKLGKNLPLAAVSKVLDVFQSKIVEETKAQQRQVVPCVSGSRLLVIDDDGVVKPCLELQDSDMQKDGLPSVNMVNIGSYDFSVRRAMKDPHARKVAKFVQDGKCHCTAECYIIPSILLSRRFFPKVAWATVKHLMGY